MTDGLKSTKRARHIFAAAVAAGLVLLGLWVLPRWRAPERPATPQPAPVATAEDGNTSVPGPDAELGATSSDLMTPPAALFDDVIAQGPKAPDLNKAIGVWVSEEKERISELLSETFERTLEMSGDWESNYLCLVLQNDAAASKPDNLMYIIHSRRFAKMIEETRDGMSASQVSALLARLDDDIAHWDRLSRSGQNLRWRRVAISGPSYKTEDLIFPLTMRLNAAILLAGERRAADALPVILKSVDMTGIDTNWSACAYACDRILTSAREEDLPTGQRDALKTYLEWKAGLEDKSFSDYKVVELPSYKSALRPHERATSMGAPVGNEYGTIKIEMPPIYRVMLVRDPVNVLAYEDINCNTTAVAKLIVEHARKFADAGR